MNTLPVHSWFGRFQSVDFFKVWLQPITFLSYQKKLIRGITAINLPFPTILSKKIFFFAAILAFQWLYYSDDYKPIITKSITIEYLFVFFPYYFRHLVPKSSFRDSLNNNKNKSEKNKLFYTVVVWITKVFYVWAKHYIGFFMNYVRFMDRVTPYQQYHMYFLLICSAFATTISMFLHTLKFKGYIGPRTSYIIYMISYLATFYSFIRIRTVFVTSPDLVSWRFSIYSLCILWFILRFLCLDLTSKALLTLGGVLANFGPSWCTWAYQIFAAVILCGMRQGNVVTLYFYCL